MAVGIELRVDTKEATRKLSRLINLIDVSELLHAIGNRHVKWMDDNLKRAGLETPHKEMAESTIAARPTRTSSRHFSSRYRSRLSQSMTVKLIGTRAVVAGTEDEFAEIHHEGTKPYTIRPVKGRILRFQTAQGFVFAREVRHPGIPSRPILPTKQTAERLAQRILDAAIKKKIRNVGAS